MNATPKTKYPELSRVIAELGPTKSADACELSRPAIKKWLDNGLPMSDLLGETDYAQRLDFACAKNDIELNWIDLIRERLADLKAGTVYRLPIDLIQPDPKQPRKQFDQDKLEALGATLKTDGQETPIKVTVDMSQGTPLIITHGERRFRAATLISKGHLDCQLDTKEDKVPTDRIFRQMADNTGEQLTKWDMACTIRQLSEEHGMKDQAISDELEARGFRGYSRPVVANLRRLFKLPQAAQDLIASGWLTPSHGKYLLACPHEQSLNEVIKDLATNQEADKEAPKVSDLEWDISNALRRNCCGLGFYTNKAGYPEFDHEKTCCDCTKKIKLRDYEYCLNETCWKAKNDEAKRDKEAEEARIEEAVNQSLKGEEIVDPELKKAVQEEVEFRQGQEEREAEQAHLQAMREAVSEAITASADPDVFLALLTMDEFNDWIIDDTEEPLTLAEILTRIKADRLGYLKMLYEETGNKLWNLEDLRNLAGHFKIDTDKLSAPSPTTDPEQQELLGDKAA